MHKNNYFKTLCVAVAFVAAGFCAQAQQVEISGYVNGLLPTGNFNDGVNLTQEYTGLFRPMDRSNIGTGATAGIGVSARAGLWLDIGFGELMPYAEASFYWNSVKSSIRDQYESHPYGDVVPRVPTYFNVPILLGIKYRYDISEIIRPFAEFGLGYDFMMITSNGYKGKGPWYTYKPNGAFAWTLGAGTYLGSHVSVGLYYVSLGTHRMNYGSKTNLLLYSGATGVGVDDENSSTVVKKRIAELALRIGFHF